MSGQAIFWCRNSYCNNVRTPPKVSRSHLPLKVSRVPRTVTKIAYVVQYVSCHTSVFTTHQRPVTGDRLDTACTLQSPRSKCAKLYAMYDYEQILSQQSDPRSRDDSAVPYQSDLSPCEPDLCPPLPDAHIHPVTRARWR